MIRTLSAIALMAIILTCLLLLAAPLRAQEIEVYTNRHHPAEVPPELVHRVQIHEVDRLSRWAETVATEIHAENWAQVGAHIQAVGQQNRAQLKAWAEAQWRAESRLAKLGNAAPLVVIHREGQPACLVPETASVVVALEVCQ